MTDLPSTCPHALATGAPDGNRQGAPRHGPADPRGECRISLGALAPGGAPWWLRLCAPVLDRLLGIRVLDRLYRAHDFSGLPPIAFAERTLDVLGIGLEPGGALEQIPARGPVLVVCNHPFGGVEALTLIKTLAPVRTDIKVLANAGLQVFRELRPLLIATNPLRVTQRNLASIRQCESHLGGGGALVLFPSGKVSYRARGATRIADPPWSRLVGHLALRTGATLLPVFFQGTNSPLFHALGALLDRSKLLMLPREFLRLRGRSIRFALGRPIPAEAWRHLNPESLTRYARAMTYLMESAPRPPTPPMTRQAPLAPLQDPARVAAELATLPAAQRLLAYQHFCVYYAHATQIPLLMADIARERERVFRLHEEGSGQERDGDAFDATYVQLFAWDHRARALVGAYRMGHSDLLGQPGGGGLYLARMFELDPAFYATRPPMLEMGRSFVAPEYQKRFYSLYLLWQGIGRYLAAHPRYRCLYGTVSLSRQYDARAIALMCEALIEPSPQVRPRYPLPDAWHPEGRDFLAAQGGRLDLATLGACVRAIDGKDLPILLKHYHKLGARFHCVGVDPNFNDTPGLLLSVDMDAMPRRLVETFLGEHAAGYLAQTEGAQTEGAQREGQR